MRIRSIKPEFWRSDDITELSREHRLLFIGLWSYVDDNGVGIDDHRRIAADLFALEDDQKEARDFVREGLTRLYVASLVDRYEVDSKAYIHIRTWKKHQRVPNPNKPRYPEPPDDYKPPTCDYVEPNEDVRRDAADPTEDLGTGTGEQRNRGTEEQRITTPARKRATGELALVPEPTADVVVTPSITAQTAVAEWVDAFKATGNKPTERQIKQAGKEAKDLIDAGNDPARIVAIARSAGSKCRATIANELALSVSHNGVYTPRPSTSDARVSQALALAETYPEDTA